MNDSAVSSILAKLVVTFGYVLVAVGFLVQYLHIEEIASRLGFPSVSFIGYYVVLPVIYMLTIRTWRLLTREDGPLPSRMRRHLRRAVPFQMTMLALVGSIWAIPFRMHYGRSTIAIGWLIEIGGGAVLAVGYFIFRSAATKIPLSAS